MTSKTNVTFLILSFSILFAGGIKLEDLTNNLTKRSLGVSKDLNFTEKINLSGKYKSDEHAVITEDGYIIKIFRIRKKDCTKYKSPPVILMVGILQSSDAFIDAGPNAGLAYLIADQCHDVWVGNQRGTYYARNHVRLNPDKDPIFWKFSIDEIGLYDVPAIIDYVLKITGEEKVNYVGFSQGGGIFFVMCSERPGYCDKVINVVIVLAPACRITNMKSEPVRFLFKSVSEFKGVLDATGFYEILPKGGLGQTLVSVLCKLRATSQTICETGIGLLDSYHPGSIDADTYKMLSADTPAGTSTHNVQRYAQSLKVVEFQKFNYGKTRNLQLYGSEEPPSYNLTAVTTPTVILYGNNDYIIDAKDVIWLANKLPNLVKLMKVGDSLWNHFDNTYAHNINVTTFLTINKYLIKYSEPENNN